MTEIPEFTALLEEIRWIGTPPILQRARKNLGDSRSSIASRSRRTGLLADLPSPHACLQDRSHFRLTLLATRTSSVSRPEATGGLYHKENEMNEDVFNGSIRKFLKTLGVSGQREIEKAVRQALAEGKLKGNEKFPATGTITLGGIGLSHEIKGEIELE